MTDQELARDLGFLEAYTIGLGTMIGAGIFVLPPIAAAAAGPAAMVSFAVGGLVSFMAALSLSELATGMPKAGGSYYYVNRSLGSFFGSVVGWGMWAGLMFASAFYMLGFGEYLTGFVPMGRTGIVAAALAMAALLTAVNYYGVKETGALQNVIVLALVAIIVAFVGVGVFDVDPGTMGAFNPHGWGAVAGTVGTVYVAFVGFEVIATSAEEIEDPGRNLPLSMIAAVVTPTLLYVLVMAVVTGTVPVSDLVASNTPISDVARQFLGGLGGVAMTLAAVLATVSSANASILSAARVNFAMGRDDVLTDWLNEVHDRFRTPYRAILATGAVILALISIGVGVGTLAEVASFSYLVTYALVHVAVVVMRRADPADYDPDFRIPGPLYPLVPLLGAAACLVVLVQMRPVVQATGVLVLGVGVAWYVGYARHQSPTASMVGEAIAPGSRAATDGGGRHTVVVPVANPETERGLLRLAAASAAGRDEAEIVAVNVIEVPRQTSLSQDLAFEQERVERQRELLEEAADAAAELDVGVRTRAIVGRDAGEALLDVVDDEDADHVLLGWRGSRSPREHVLGSTIDPVVRRAECEVSLVALGGDAGRVVALAGDGPNAPVAVRRAVAVATAADASLTLLNVQAPDDGDPVARGESIVDEAASRAGVEPSAYETRVVVAGDVGDAVLETLGDDDAVCVGATRSSPVSRALFGSLPERIGREHGGTVAIVRGADPTPRSVREAIVARLSDS